MVSGSVLGDWVSRPFGPVVWINMGCDLMEDNGERNIQGPKGDQRKVRWPSRLVRGAGRCVC